MIFRILTHTTTLGQSGPGISVNDDVLHNFLVSRSDIAILLQSFSIVEFGNK